MKRRIDLLALGGALRERFPEAKVYFDTRDHPPVRLAVRHKDTGTFEVTVWSQGNLFPRIDLRLAKTQLDREVARFVLDWIDNECLPG